MSNFMDSIKKSVQARSSAIVLNHAPTVNKLNFLDAFSKDKRPAIIAEVKLSSPSKGRIYNGNLDSIAIAGEYLANGAAALSILTEPDFFNGNIETIRTLRKIYPQANILLKDFVLTELQIDEACVYGANAVLLIVGFLNKKRLSELYKHALSLGITPLIEIHNLDELKIAITLNPKLLGFNHRDLKSLTINLDSSKNLRCQIPKDITFIAESGITTKDDLILMMRRGFDGCLIGSSLMSHANPGKALGQLLSSETDLIKQ
ncbi:MAG: indole-3-glycerol-phosphate synthase [Legionellaceae bacterium]|nr:indole-3-glycerol-phosphate synthase [Legionellaceae bacterium]